MEVEKEITVDAPGTDPKPGNELTDEQVSGLDTEQYRTFRETGKLPEKEEEKEEEEKKEDQEKEPVAADEAERKADEESGTSQDDEKEEEEEEGEEGKAAKPKRKGGFQRRIQKLTRERDEEASKRAAAERRLADAGVTGEKAEIVEQKQPPVEGAKPVKPDEENFDDVTEYLKADAKYEEQLIEWQVDQRFKARDEADAQRQAQAQHGKFLDGWDKKATAFTKDHEDYIEVVAEAVPKNTTVQHAIMENDNGCAIAYHIGQNPEVLDEINGLTTTRALVRIGQIAASLSSSDPPKPKPKTKKTSNAPTPPTSIQGSKASVDPNIENMGPDEYRQRREAGKRV